MGKQYVQYVSSFIAMTGMICTGLHVGWSSPNLPKMLDGRAGFYISRGEASWIVSFFFFGSVPGCLVAKLIVDRIGRKTTILLSAWPYMLAWVVTYFASEAWHVYCAQLSAGIALGMGLVVTSMYTGEIAEKEVRGAMSSVVNFGINIGSLFALCIGPYLPYKYVAFVSIIVPLIFFLASLWIPESPYYYLMKGDRANAERVMLILRQESKPAAIDDELSEMETSIKNDMQNRSSLKELVCEKVYRRSIIILFGMRSYQQLCGNMGVVSYMEEIFNSMGMNMSGSVSAILYGVVQVISGVLATILTDRLGRKPLMFFSFIGHSLSLTLIGGYFFAQDYMGVDKSVLASVSWIPFASLMLFCVCYSVGIGSLAYVLLAEYFPANVKSVAVSGFSVYGSLLAFAVSKLYLEIADAAGAYIAFWIFAAFCYSGVAFTHFLMPETRNKSFNEIQCILNKHLEPNNINTSSKEQSVDAIRSGVNST